jgi:5-methyltetrahydrofolate--homocysteine methyltransferase
MKRAVGYLEPYMEAEKTERQAVARVVLATVKGDVHDIGKNIVGVVLGCNGYEVIDLGVMVPADRILDTALEQDCDIVGLSGLITPSLDEMVSVAKEMERRGIELPLLIGGATTSKQHTAVRIAPEYGQPTVHVLDASRVVGVVGDLLDDDRRSRLDAENRADQERLRALHAERGRKPLLSLREARGRRTPIDWHVDDLEAPPFTGARLVEEPIAVLRDYVDWSFFFHAWELKGRYPAILDDPEKGEVARDLFAAANELLDDVAAAGSLRARGVYGFWPARAEGDDLVLDGGIRFPMLRQQAAHDDSRPNRSLADFVAPVDTGLADHVGAFAVGVHGAQELAERFVAELDDYRAIMVRALADRLAEAFAERLHETARRAWYAPEELLTNDERIAERFRGIRPAFGYPACPDHSEKRTLLALLDAEQAGVGLTESFATTPAASVSGLYFAHPQARYFSVGRIGRDQAADYAERKGVTLPEVERWLRQNLAYEP